ncbi:MAG TPA: efflux RND transporter permease subunit [Chitinispirillaceae bacterium]|nr:efflux RND transporter permease subunit [Chitinispirillaceae bacterium]
MKLVNLSIRRKVALTMVYIIAVGFGLFSLSQLKLAMTPDIDFPIVLVVTSYSGVSPEDIENLVTRPIEEAVSSTENIQNITSQSLNGRSLVMLEFDWGTDMDNAEIDVRNSLDMVRDYLPQDADEPIVVALNPSMMPIMALSMNSNELSPAELRRLGEDRVKPLLERIKGVASVGINGGLERRINVNLDPVRLASHSLSPMNIVQSIQGSAGLVSSGNIRTVTKEYNLRIYSEYRSIDQIRNVIVKPGAVPIRLKDVANVEDGFEEATGDVRINGAQGVGIILSKQSDANTVLAAKLVREALPEILKVLPGDIKFSTIFDSSEFTTKSIDNLSSTAFMAFIIVVFLIYLFLRNWRSSMIMAVSMPVSIILTFAVLYLSDLTLNVISMAGLALAIGMLVDNSIIVLENIVRHHDKHTNISKAADEGASEVSSAIIASTLTTVSVFLPVLFVPDITGVMFKEMVLTITFSLTVSLIVALTLVPMMSSIFLKRKKRKENSIQNDIKPKNSIFVSFASQYQRFLHWSIYHKKFVIGAVILLFIGSFALVPLIGGEFMPETDQGRVSVTIECATGSPLVQLRQIVLRIEEILKEDFPEITSAMFQFGAQSGFNPGGSSGNTITTNFRLVPLNERNRSQKEIENELRKKLQDIAGITYSFEGGGMMSNQSAIEIKVIGHDLVKAKAIADDIKMRMEKIEGLVDIKLNVSDYVPQLDVHLKQDVMNDLNLSNLQIASMVSTAIQGKTISRYREEGDEYDIYVQFDQKYRQSRDALGDITIPVPTGGSVPLRQIANIKESQSPVTIYRENQERYIAVSCNLAGIDLSNARRQIEQIQSDLALPSDFMVIIGGNAEDQQEANFYLMIAFFVAAILVYMVMAAQFESFIDPFIIMFTIPLSIIGVLGFLFITNTPVSVMALVGVVMLVGIAVNNGIVLVDYINQLRDRGTSLYEAAEQSGVIRLRPVLMTALTTIIGMVPLALEIGDGAETWAPLARAVIGGLTMTTLLTLVVIPVVYILFEEFGGKIKSRLFKA